MAPRAHWKGYLKLSPVSCRISLYPAASSSERVSFNRINKRTGHRIRQINVDGGSGEPVDKEDIGRGYEVDEGQYVLVEDDELEKIQLVSIHTIEIDSFVPRAEIDDRYIDSPYYVVPADQVSQEAFAVIRNAIRDRGMVGLGRVVLSRRERVVMLEAFDKGLLATSLRQAYEVRDPGAYFEAIPELQPPAELSRLASHVAETRASHFDPRKFEDRYENALIKLLRKKQAKHAIEPVQDEGLVPPQVTDLMDPPGTVPSDSGEANDGANRQHRPVRS